MVKKLLDYALTLDIGNFNNCIHGHGFIINSFIVFWEGATKCLELHPSELHPHKESDNLYHGQIKLY